MANFFISAINANYVTVEITAPEEDLLGQEVEVKNAAGEVVPVKALDIAAGDETAEFEFVTAVKADDLKGVWTVNGQSYDLDLFNKIADVLDASTQLQLHEALSAFDLESYVPANISEYYTAQQKLKGTVEAEELTLADIEKLVEDANTAVAEGKDEKGLLKAIEDAVEADNQVAFLTALNNAGLTQVNPDWVATATTGYFATIDGKEADLKAVQTKIDTANTTIINAGLTAGTIVDDGIDKEKLTKAKAIIDAYAPVNDSGVIINSTIKTASEAIIEQLALVDVLEATTPTAFKNRLAGLADLVDNPTILDMDDYIDANGKAYIEALRDAAVADKDTVAEVEGILFSYKSSASGGTDAVDNVNLKESTKLIDAVNDAADPAGDNSKLPTTDEEKAALVKALRDLGVKQVSDENIDVYAASAASYRTGSVDSLTDAQNQVDTDNVKAVNDAVTANDEAKIIAKLNVFGVKNVVEANAKAYVNTPTAIGTITADATGDNKKTVKDVQAKLDASNKAITEASQVEAINKAEDVATVKVALDALANVGSAPQYLTIRSVDRDFVAAYVLNERPATPGYVNLAAIQAEIFTAGTPDTGAIAEHAVALGLLNAIKVDTPINTVVVALDATLDEGFKALNPTEKVIAAEAFHDELTFKATDGTLQTPFVTLAAAKALLK